MPRCAMNCLSDEICEVTGKGMGPYSSAWWVTADDCDEAWEMMR